VAATDGPAVAALDGVISAWQTAREVDALARSAALAYAYAGQADEAFQTLGSLAQNARAAPTAQWAKQWQNRLEAGVTRGDILAEMRRSSVPDTSFKDWTIDKGQVMQKVERSHGLEAAESFIKEMERQNAAPPANAPGAGADRR
jgi:hypothetical protein